MQLGVHDPPSELEAALRGPLLGAVEVSGAALPGADPAAQGLDMDLERPAFGLLPQAGGGGQNVAVVLNAGCRCHVDASRLFAAQAAVCELPAVLAALGAARIGALAALGFRFLEPARPAGLHVMPVLSEVLEYSRALHQLAKFLERP